MPHYSPPLLSLLSLTLQRLHVEGCRVAKATLVRCSVEAELASSSHRCRPMCHHDSTPCRLDCLRRSGRHRSNTVLLLQLQRRTDRRELDEQHHLHRLASHHHLASLLSSQHEFQAHLSEYSRRVRLSLHQLRLVVHVNLLHLPAYLSRAKVCRSSPHLIARNTSSTVAQVQHQPIGTAEHAIPFQSSGDRVSHRRATQSVDQLHSTIAGTVEGTNTGSDLRTTTEPTDRVVGIATKITSESKINVSTTIEFGILRSLVYAL